MTYLFHLFPPKTPPNRRFLKPFFDNLIELSSVSITTISSEGRILALSGAVPIQPEGGGGDDPLRCPPGGVGALATRRPAGLGGLRVG